MQPANIKSVGIIGAGRIGQTMARIARRAGRPVVIAHKEGPQSLADQRLRPQRPERAHVKRGRRRSRRSCSRGENRQHLRGRFARIRSTPSRGQRVMFLSGDNADAKSEVGELFAAAGFFVIDLGGLREGGQMRQFGAPLAGHNLIRFA
jgi:predicted dinucleotide-binding enzyme